MAFTVGSIVPLGIDIKDPNGNLVDGGTVTITVTKPDGALDGPTTITSSPNGVYGYDFVSDQAGRHISTWTVTGQNAGVFTDSFYVDPQTWDGLVGLQEAREELNFRTEVSDEELRSIILSATDAVESYTHQPFRPRTYTETFSGGGPCLNLRHFPVTAITSITENGRAVTGYRFEPQSGVVLRSSGYYALLWLWGYLNITVTYSAGSPTIPADIRRATLELARHLWTTQRGGLSSALAPSDEWDPQLGYSLPRRVTELLDPYRMPGFA